jgi:urease accessory protein
VAATDTLHGVGIAVGVIHRWGWGRVALRVAGGLVAAAAAFFLWRAVA